jgi:hypothetical protein
MDLKSLSRLNPFSYFTFRLLCTFCHQRKPTRIVIVLKTRRELDKEGVNREGRVIQPES